MKSIRLAVEHTEETVPPMHEFVREAPFVEREFLLEWRATESTRTLVSYVEGRRDPYAGVLERRPDVTEYDLSSDDGDGFFVYARARNRDPERALFDAFSVASVVVMPPVEVRPDRTMRLTLVGPPDALQAAVDGLPAGAGVDVLAVGEFARGVGRTLTDRQREAVVAAWRAGYYELPREGGVEGVAERLDCAVSTASDLLRRAERRLVEEVLDGAGGPSLSGDR